MKKDRSKHKSLGGFSLASLLKSKHGLACVANIDARGDVPINALFKRSSENSKPSTFDFASILGYVGGEFRDGFSQVNLEENEAVRFLQTQIASLEEKRIGMAIGPVEDVAALFLLPLYVKSMKKGFRFPDSETENAFDYFRRVAHYSRYSSPEDCFRIKLRSLSGRDITKARDSLSEDLNLWSIDEVEIEFHECPFPPAPPNWPSSSSTDFDNDPTGMLQHLGWALKAYEDADNWKKLAAMKFSTPENYERFGGMVKQQALWYIWKGNLEKAAVMVHCWNRLEDNRKMGNPLDIKNPAIDVIFNTTHNDLSNDSFFDGCPKPDARTLRVNKCDVCSGPVYVRNLDSIREPYGRTCVDRDGNAEFGSEDVRDNMAKLLFAISKFGCNHDFETSATHCFKEALHVFLAHSFNQFYWRIKPTRQMKEATEAQTIPAIVKLLSNKGKGELDLPMFSSSCESILRDALLKHCESKLKENQIITICDFFRVRLGLLVYDIQKIADDTKEEKLAGRESEKDVAFDLLSKTMIPSFASEFQGKWTRLPEAKRQKILTTDSKVLLKTCDETFEKMRKIYSRQQRNLEGQGLVLKKSARRDDHTLDDEKKANKAENMSELFIPDCCTDGLCSCKDAKKFYNTFVNILSSENNPVPFYKCDSTGNIVMNEEMCQDQDGDNVGCMVAFNFEYINTTLNSIEKEKFSSCPRLALMCKRVCQNVYPLVIISLCQGFVEVQQKKDTSKSDLHTCPTCGKKEEKAGEFKRCGSCKNAYYCCRKCQVQDWKAGHKQKCGQ